MKINLTCVLLATLVFSGCGARPDLATRETAGEGSVSDDGEVSLSMDSEKDQGTATLESSALTVDAMSEDGSPEREIPAEAMAESATRDPHQPLPKPLPTKSPARVSKANRTAESQLKSAASARARKKSARRTAMPATAMPTTAMPPAAMAPSAAFDLAIDADSEVSDSTPEPMASPSEATKTLPAGASHDSKNGLSTIQVYYATDRRRGEIALSDYDVVGNRKAVIVLGSLCLLFSLFAMINLLRRRSQLGLVWTGLGIASAAGVVFVWMTGGAGIEKRGVTYTADRGELVRGICEVTVPDSHQRGMVERPSLLRFEVSENQSKHIVLTSATELDAGQFQRRLAETVSESPDQDMLVFVHGYNVDFQSAVARTAQIAVDLPFEGVPVCYSWPSQATLLGYTVDETNAAWTQSHLKQFLLELVELSGARSINVVAHSMGNRPTTGAIVDLNRDHQLAKTDDKLAKLDRLVLAAPDVDADRFRRDLAKGLSDAANHVTLYASSDDQALIASKKVHGHPRAGESGANVLVVPGIETIDVSGIDLSLLGHSYYGDNDSMLKDLYAVVRERLFAKDRRSLRPLPYGQLTYWRLMKASPRVSSERGNIR